MKRSHQVVILVIEMAEEGFGDSIREIVEDIVAGVGDRDHDRAVNADSESAGNHTPVRRKARIAPQVVKIAARFGTVGGSLDRRSGLTDRWVEDSPVRFGFDSPAGDLALPASTTWSNNTIREANSTIREANNTIREAVSRKGNRNNRHVAEGVVGRYAGMEDRAAEKKLGRGSGYYASKSWQNYGHKLGKNICGACYGACCNATRDFVSCLVEAHFLPAESQSPSVSFV